MPASTTDAPPRLRFGHVGINCQDIERMKDFYTRVVGFTVTDEGQAGPNYMVFLSVHPDEHHNIFLCSGPKCGIEPAQPGVERRTVINHVALHVESLAELRRMGERLEGEVAHMAPSNHGIAWSIYTVDPEGNELEFFVDTPWFIPQPLRFSLDLSLSDDEIYKLTEEYCQKQEGFRPYKEWFGDLAKRVERAPAE